MKPRHTNKTGGGSGVQPCLGWAGVHQRPGEVSTRWVFWREVCRLVALEGSDAENNCKAESHALWPGLGFTFVSLLYGLVCKAHRRRVQAWQTADVADVRHPRPQPLQRGDEVRRAAVVVPLHGPRHVGTRSPTYFHFVVAGGGGAFHKPKPHPPPHPLRKKFSHPFRGGHVGVE